MWLSSYLCLKFMEIFEPQKLNFSILREVKRLRHDMIRNSLSQISFKIGILKNFTYFTVKHMCCDLFLIGLWLSSYLCLKFMEIFESQKLNFSIFREVKRLHHDMIRRPDSLQLYQKRDSNTGVLLWNLWTFLQSSSSGCFCMMVDYELNRSTASNFPVLKVY